jgi:hypothetical protein
MGYEHGESCIPSDSELLYLGFEDWQIFKLRQLPAESQRIVYDEFLRLLMEGDDSLLDF